MKKRSFAIGRLVLVLLLPATVFVALRRMPVNVAKPSANPEAATAAHATLSSEPNSSVPEASYPHGRWRLAAPSALANVALWSSHILVSYHGLGLREPALHLANEVVGEGATRTREEAWTLAQSVLREAKANPGAFAELARKYSDDRLTRERGGSLGGVSASSWMFYPTVLDAFQVLRPGEISEIVETRFGFHVFQRHEPPVERVVTGQRLVIAHAEAPFLRDAQPTRSRAEAHALAAKIYQVAKADRDSFPALIAQSSEHEDGGQSGDIGTWSTREGSYFPLEVEALAAVPVGEIVPPMDGLFGVEILRRVPNPVRQPVAMNYVFLPYDPKASPQDASSRERVSAHAHELIATIAATPPQFDALRSELCCPEVKAWVAGRGSPVLTEGLLSVDVGQVVPKPLRDGPMFLIARRVSAPALPAPEVRFELPAPEKASLSQIIAMNSPDLVQALLLRVGRQAASLPELSPAAAASLEALHAASDRFQAVESDEGRDDAVATFLSQVRELLNSRQFEAYEVLLNSLVERAVLHGEL